MEEKYIICMDGSADLESEIVKQNDIHIIPMSCSLNDEMLLWSIQDDEKAKELYQAQRKGDLTKTTLINPFAYEEFFKPLLEEGKDILYLCLSSGLSSTYQSVQTAILDLKDQYPERKIVAVDTLSATSGIGFLILKAIENRNNGVSLEENANALDVAKKHIAAEFLVQDLEYLKRGGRVSSAAAVVGSLLNIVPLLCINEEGKLETMAKVRGHKKAIDFLLDRFDKNYAGGPIFIIDSDEEKLREQLMEMLKARKPESEFHHTLLSPIIGAHTGPGMLALVYQKK